MNGKYSLPVVKAVDLIWTSFDREEIHRGYAMLMQAAQQGDADARSEEHTSELQSQR